MNLARKYELRLIGNMFDKIPTLVAAHTPFVFLYLYITSHDLTCFYVVSIGFKPISMPLDWMHVDL